VTFVFAVLLDLLGASLGLLGFCLVGLSVLAAEALDASGGIDQLLLAGEKRVAIRADFEVNIALMGGSGGKRVPAGAHHADFVICGMNLLFHSKAFLWITGAHGASPRVFREVIILAEAPKLRGFEAPQLQQWADAES
jgi:hypothetical protein